MQQCGIGILWAYVYALALIEIVRTAYVQLTVGTNQQKSWLATRAVVVRLPDTGRTGGVAELAAAVAVQEVPSHANALGSCANHI